MSESNGYDATGAGAGAGAWIRFGARLIDGALLAIVGTPIGWALDYNFVWLVLYAVFIYGYFVFCDVNFGRTIGKRILGLHVSGPTGGSPSVEEAGRREAFTLLGAIPFIGGLFSFVAAISIGITIDRDAAKEGWHDRFAGGTDVTRT